jgi:GT2 family glycosyltransferase
MQRAPSVDVLIVSFQTRDLLRDCIASIVRHRPPPEDIDVRISVLDNGSSDGSPEMVASEFPFVRLVESSENLGFGRANNELAETSAAEYLLLLNSDTIWSQDVVTPLLRVLRSWPGAGVVAPRLVGADGVLQHSSMDFPSPRLELAHVLRGTKLSRLFPGWDPDGDLARMHQEQLTDSREARETDFLWATCWLLPRSLVATHGLFRPEFHMYDEDLDFCRRMQASGVKLVYCPDVELTHLGSGSSLPAAKAVMMRRARSVYYRLNHSPLAAATVTYGVGGLRTLKAVKQRVAASRR